MDTLKFLKEFKRMCDCYSGGFCAGCPRKESASCDSSTMNDKELTELIADVEKWSEEHPKKTRLQDFQEKHPNAYMLDCGIPVSCCYDLGYCRDDGCILDCEKCWNMPAKEE